MEFSRTFRSYRELAAIIATLPDDVQDAPVVFGDVRGDRQRDAFSIDEIGTVNTAVYVGSWDGQRVKQGAWLLF